MKRSATGAPKLRLPQGRPASTGVTVTPSALQVIPEPRRTGISPQVVIPKPRRLGAAAQATQVPVPTQRRTPQVIPGFRRTGLSQQVRTATTRTGEVRFDDPEAATRAFGLDGQQYQGYWPKVKADLMSQDGTKILVMGLPPNCEWQDLKDLMREFGVVAFVQVKDQVPSAVAPGPQQAAMQPEGEQAVVGQVRFENAEDAYRAVESLNGDYVGGQPISVELDPVLHCGQRSSVLVHGLQPSFGWQDLKDLMRERVGPVAYSHVGPAPAGPSGLSSTTASASVEELQAVGEVRFEHAESARLAMDIFPDYQGHPLTLKADSSSQDATKILIMGLPVTCTWPQLKDFMSAAGPVAYAGVKPVGGGLAVSPPFSRPMAGVRWAEVRYDDPQHALEALLRASGTYIQGHQVTVEMDPQSGDGSKLKVMGLPPSIRWQELKDHFSQFGQVGFAQVG